MCVKKFMRVILMVLVVFTEYEVFKALLFVDYRKGVYLVIPDNIVGFVK